MTYRLLRVPLLACALLASVEANADTIDFEGYADPTVLPVVVDSGATFTPVGGGDFAISAFGQPTWGTTAPMILCPRLPGSIACESGFQVDFASDVSDLRFSVTGGDLIVGDGVFTELPLPEIRVSVFNDGVLLTTLRVFTSGDPFHPTLIPVSEWNFHIERIDRIVVDGIFDHLAGYGYDDFSFEVAPPPPAVPEPASIVLLGSGLFALVIRRRKARSKDPC